MAQRHDENYNEQPMTRMGRIQQPSRRYRRLRHPSFTAAIWTANNPLLQRGEIGSEIDTGKLKIGDGVTYWNDLGYVAASEIAFADITGTPDDNVALKNALDAKQDVLTEGTGIDIDSTNVISNTGVRSIATGTTNGTISVNTGGTSAEVAVYGLGSAAYTSSGDYATAAQGILADNAANKDLSNLSSTGANIGNWSSNVSNCLVEIPQDLNIVLSGGSLTIKAGSKGYLPDGTAVSVANDITFTASSTLNRLLFLNSAGTGIDYINEALCYSGTSAPTVSGTARWFDTANLVIKQTTDSGATWTTLNETLPIAIFHTTSGSIDSVQVFNGFGYIGSTIFALPGVKALLPNGRNADGTLNNTLLTESSIQFRTVGSGTNTYPISITNTGSIGAGTNYIYNEKENRLESGGTIYLNRAVVGQISFVSGKITSLEIKTPFHAVDYSDTEYIAHQAMPSDRYVDLTLPASGSTVTAPADGYLTINKSATAAGQYINFINGSNGMNCNSIAPSALPLRLYMPVSKGDVITVNYDADGTTSMFRFVYANGAK